jgi:hypothetical protein
LGGYDGSKCCTWPGWQWPLAASEWQGKQTDFVNFEHNYSFGTCKDRKTAALAASLTPVLAHSSMTFTHLVVLVPFTFQDSSSATIWVLRRCQVLCQSLDAAITASAAEWH